jgi:phosphate transport system protein
MAGHRQEFERELEAIEAKVIELFAMVAEDLPSAPQALLRGNTEVPQMLAEREHVIEALCSQIEELATRQILLQAPVACDLRFLLSVLRISPDLDRCHHLIVDIAARASRILGEDLSPGTRGLTERMGALASDMWRRAADAWYQRDPSAAAWLRQRDDEMHDLRASLTAELACGRMTLPVTMEMTLVGRSYEGLGDHAVDIARRVVYLTGSAPRQLSPLSEYVHGSQQARKLGAETDSACRPGRGPSARTCATHTKGQACDGARGRRRRHQHHRRAQALRSLAATRHDLDYGSNAGRIVPRPARDRRSNQAGRTSGCAAACGGDL